MTMAISRPPGLTSMRWAPAHSNWPNSSAASDTCSNATMNIGATNHFFREIQIPVVPDISQQILQLQAGTIDAVPINYPFSQLDGLPAGLEITGAPSMTLYALFTKPGSPLDDAEIRMAVMTAINPALWAGDA